MSKWQSVLHGLLNCTKFVPRKGPKPGDSDNQVTWSPGRENAKSECIFLSMSGRAVAAAAGLGKWSVYYRYPYDVASFRILSNLASGWMSVVALIAGCAIIRSNVRPGPTGQ